MVVNVRDTIEIPAPQRVMTKPSWIKVGEKPRPGMIVYFGFVAFVIAVFAGANEYLSGDREYGLLLFGLGCLLFLMVMIYRSGQSV